MSATFLLACYEVPGWGGASTFLYTLYERMQHDGFRVEYLNLVKDLDEPYLRKTFGPQFGNPAELDAVRTCIMDSPLWRVHPNIVEAIRAAQPDLVVVCGFIAAWLMKRAAPGIPIAFITSGCSQIKQLMRRGAIDDFMDFERRIARGITFEAAQGDQERGAVQTSDLIIVHSPIVRRAFEHFFPAYMGKVYADLISIADCVYAEAATFAHLQRPFAERDIDAIFIASNWSRAEKNYPLVQRIAVACTGLRVHIVGQCPQPDLQAQYHGVITRRVDLYTLLGRAKAIVCPSRFDPAPGVLFEASAMGCNVVASPNCGNWELCNEQLLARSPAGFVSRTRRATTAPHADNRERFRGGYDNLIGTLTAFV